MMQTILLIDDDEDDIFFHSRAIRKCELPFVIDVCRSSDDALNYLKNSGAYKDRDDQLPTPDLVFLDVNMPRMNGWELLDSYANFLDHSDQRRKPLIFVLTTSLNAADQKRAHESELVCEYLEKPLRSKVLKRIVDDYDELGLVNKSDLVNKSPVWVYPVRTI